MFQASLLNDDGSCSSSVSPVYIPISTISSDPIDADSLSPLLAAKTSNNINLKISSRREVWRPGHTGTIFWNMANNNTSLKIKSAAIEIIQHVSMWSNNKDTLQPFPLSKSDSRVLIHSDILTTDLNASAQKGDLMLTLPRAAPPSCSIPGLHIAYEISFILTTDTGNMLPIRLSSDLIVTHEDQSIVFSNPYWDHINEEEQTTQAMINSAVEAEMHKLTLETQAEYEDRVAHAQESARLALIAAEEKHLLEMKEQIGSTALQYEAMLKENEEKTKLLLKEKEEELKKRLKESEEKNLAELKIAQEQAAVEAALKHSQKLSSNNNLNNSFKKPVLSSLPGIGGKILGTALIAIELKFESEFKDSAMYQMAKLYYFDLTPQIHAQFSKQGQVPSVVVLTNEASGIRVTRENVPSWNT